MNNIRTLQVRKPLSELPECRVIHKESDRQYSLHAYHTNHQSFSSFLRLLTNPNHHTPIQSNTEFSGTWTIHNCLKVSSSRGSKTFLTWIDFHQTYLNFAMFIWWHCRKMVISRRVRLASTRVLNTSSIRFTATLFITNSVIKYCSPVCRSSAR